MPRKRPLSESAVKQKNSSVLFFKARLRELRGGRTQGEFAAQLGISSQQTYAHYEAGRLPPVEVLLQLALQEKVSLDSLLIEGATSTPLEIVSTTAHSTSALTLAAMSDTELAEVVCAEASRLQTTDLPAGARAHCCASIIDAAAELMRRGRGAAARRNPAGS